MDDEFGAGYARVLAGTQSLTGLRGRTVVEALADGVPPREVWAAVCAHMRVPPERALGRPVEQGPAGPADGGGRPRN